jgi:hypothetical protein
LDEKSAFRPCGRDLVEFFNSTGWACLGQVAVPTRLPDAGRLRGSNLPKLVLGQCDKQRGSEHLVRFELGYDIA